MTCLTSNTTKQQNELDAITWKEIKIKAETDREQKAGTLNRKKIKKQFSEKWRGRSQNVTPYRQGKTGEKMSKEAMLQTSTQINSVFNISY